MLSRELVDTLNSGGGGGAECRHGQRFAANMQQVQLVIRKGLV
jgi:hypothetical protein